MLDSDRKEFYAAWVAVMNMYGKPVHEKSTEIVFAVLKRYDINSVKQAIVSHLSDTESGQFAPKPADIIRHIEGGSDVRALTAWTKVETAIRGVGSWFELVFDDPSIHCCVEDMGGWMVFATVTTDDLPFLRNQFCKRYQGYIAQPPTRWARTLVGESNTGQVRFIGNNENCQRVLSGGDDGMKQISAPKMMAEIMQKMPGLLTNDG